MVHGQANCWKIATTLVIALVFHGTHSTSLDEELSEDTRLMRCAADDIGRPEQGAVLLQLAQPGTYSRLEALRRISMPDDVDSSLAIKESATNSDSQVPHTGPIQASCRKTTDGELCVFPFAYNGVVNYNCSTQDAYSEWCATAVDENGLYIRGKWNYCGESCEAEDGGGSANFSEETSEEGTRLEVPLSEKMKNLARNVMAIHALPNTLDKDLPDMVHAVTYAKEVEMQASLGMNISSAKAGRLESMLENQSAESAAANSQLITASDVAASSNGTRGEDLSVGPPNMIVFEGDMIAINSTQLSLFQQIRGGSQRWIAAGEPWSDAKVKYCFASDISHRSKHMFQAAAKQYTRAVPCLTFQDVGWKSGSSSDALSEQACKESPAIFVISRKDAGCYSYVGMIPQFQSQQLQLNDPACLSLGTAIHEIGHALGMAHEQSRPDRKRYVHVDLTNIDPIHYHDFKVVEGAYTGHPYDFLSIMHYDAFAFAVDHSRPTIVRADGSHKEMGNRVGLSKFDVQQVAKMYVEVKSDCAGTAVAGMGCVDRVDQHGVNVCSKAKRCDSKVLDLCCGCGGGVKVQCYKGSECPQPPKLPEPEGSECILDKTGLVADWKAKHKCVFTNACKFKVQWKCPSTQCTHLTKPGGLWMMDCNGKRETEICQQGVCTVAKVV